MGADLYIRAITEPARAKYEPLFNQAVENRNSLTNDLKGFESFVEIYKEAGEALPSIRKPINLAQRKIIALKARISAAQTEVEKYFTKMDGQGGYFRDSYNGTSVLWRLGLSWWKDIPGGMLTVDQLREALNKIKSRKLPPLNVADLKEAGCSVDAGENSPKAWQKMFRNKKRRLIRFFERAIRYREQGSEVYFSL